MLTGDLTTSTLNTLIRLNLAGELGFETAAEHVKNRGLKLYLKSYAQQRAQFADELRSELRQRGGIVHLTPNPLAAFHRGWIDIKAALTVGRDNEARVVLQEALRGERVALAAYARAQQTVLPVDVDELLQHQATQIQAVCDHLCSLAECGDDTTLVQLFEQSTSAQQAIQQLAADGIDHVHMQSTLLTQFNAYTCHCRRQRLLESSSAGALSGLLVGILLSLTVALPLLLADGAAPWLSGLVLPLLFGALLGALGGALFGLLISQGITEDDAHLYERTLQQGGLILAVQTATAQVPNVRQILQVQRNQERQATVW
jgi:uncharacterized protein (TIGR02284 family)